MMISISFVFVIFVGVVALREVSEPGDSCLSETRRSLCNKALHDFDKDQQQLYELEKIKKDGNNDEAKKQAQADIISIIFHRAIDKLNHRSVLEQQHEDCRTRGKSDSFYDVLNDQCIHPIKHDRLRKK